MSAILDGKKFPLFRIIVNHCKLYQSIKLFVVLREEVPTTVSKPALSWFAKEKLKKLSGEAALEVGMFTIESIGANRLLVFEEEVSHFHHLD